MSFQFNFTLENTDETETETFARLDKQKKSDDSSDFACVEVSSASSLGHVSAEVKPCWNSHLYQVSPSARYELSDGSVLECALPADDGKSGHDSELYQNIAMHTDLLPNVYEGGFKVWECSVDLANYLAQEKFVFKDKFVLELGCGAGLPGTYALLHGAAVHFQDYNVEVLQQVTIPSVIVNTQRQRLSPPSRCRFFHGDWDTLTSAIDTTEKYDVILASETVYNRASYQKFHSVLAALLKQDGEVYIAAKTCYFGVGGGSQDFAAYVRHCNMFDVEIVHSITTGVQRETLKLTMRETVDRTQLT